MLVSSQEEKQGRGGLEEKGLGREEARSGLADRGHAHSNAEGGPVLEELQGVLAGVEQAANRIARGERYQSRAQRQSIELWAQKSGGKTCGGRAGRGRRGKQG